MWGLFKGTIYYRKVLLLILIIATFPGLLLSGLMYWIAEDKIENELHQLHQQSTRERAQSIDGNLANLELSLGHWAFEPQFDYSLGELDFVKDFAKIWDLSKTLVIMESSNELIERAELYIKGSSKQEGVLFNPELNRLEQAQVNDTYEQLLQNTSSIFWTTDKLSNSQEQQLTLVQKVPGNSRDPVGLLLYRINTDKLANLVGTMTPYNRAKTLIVQDDGLNLISSGVIEDDEAFVQQLIQKASLHGQSNELFYVDWKGSKYSVFYDHFNEVSTRWAYISAAPIQEITNPILYISKWIIAVSCVALLVAISMAWMASKRIYSPIGKLLNMFVSEREGLLGKRIDEFSLINEKWQNLNRESTILHIKLKNDLPHLKYSFVQQLIQGFLAQYSSNELSERFRQYGVDVDKSTFTVVYIQLIGFGAIANRFNKGDEGLVTFAACNIIEESIKSNVEQAFVINFHDLSLALLIVESGDAQRERVHSLCREFAYGINQFLRMQVTASIAPATSDIKQIAPMFESAKSATNYRSFDNENQIIDMEQNASLMVSVSAVYPFNIEREFIIALRAGEREEAVKQLASFVDALSAEGMKEIDVQQWVMRLLVGILNAVSQMGVNPASLSNGANMFDELSKLRDTQSILKWFNEHIIDSFMEELQKRSNDQAKRQVEKAKQYIQMYYAKDISLESCADHVGIASHTLSRVLKLETGLNFTEYLTDIRMEKAKSLLRESDIMINEIAIHVGYQPTYFNRLFKKLEGITPGRFRELSREGSH